MCSQDAGSHLRRKGAFGSLVSCGAFVGLQASLHAFSSIETMSKPTSTSLEMKLQKQGKCLFSLVQRVNCMVLVRMGKFIPLESVPVFTRRPFAMFTLWSFQYDSVSHQLAAGRDVCSSKKTHHRFGSSLRENCPGWADQPPFNDLLVDRVDDQLTHANLQGFLLETRTTRGKNDLDLYTVKICEGDGKQKCLYNHGYVAHVDVL